MTRGHPKDGRPNALARYSINKSIATGTGKYTGIERQPIKTGQSRKAVSVITCAHRGRAPNGSNSPEAKLSKEEHRKSACCDVSRAGALLPQVDCRHHTPCDCDQPLEVGQVFWAGTAVQDRAGHHNWREFYWACCSKCKYADGRHEEGCDGEVNTRSGIFLGVKVIARSIVVEDVPDGRLKTGLKPSLKKPAEPVE